MVAIRKQFAVFLKKTKCIITETYYYSLTTGNVILGYFWTSIWGKSADFSHLKSY